MRGVMFNAYPDSCGATLAECVSLLQRPELSDAFSLFYVLPSMFRSDLDRGFSVISYDLDPAMATRADLARLRAADIALKLDFVLNHLSAKSPEFQDLIARGDASDAKEMFLDWNAFWAGHGTVSEAGYVVPDREYLERLFMRKPGLPILPVPFPDGTTRYYWNTFYQHVSPDDPREIQGQMDLDGRSERVWAYYDETLSTLAAYGARIVRLDAFAYLHKEIGQSNFFNRPGTWDYLSRLQGMADERGLELLPEIHATYADAIHSELADRGYRIYDFFFPALVIDAIAHGSAEFIERWAREIVDRGYRTVNMLGCHDGIPVLDVRGLLPEERIEGLIELITGRGGRMKNLYGPDGTKIAYYQVNATFFSALGEDEASMLLARALQLFMPGIPQVWYLDLFAGVNDHAAADAGGHKEINRTNLSPQEIERRLAWPVVARQIELLRLRNTHPAFAADAAITVERRGDSGLSISWKSAGAMATLHADCARRTFEIETT